jgi:chorismate--pyruvate lyase
MRWQVNIKIGVNLNPWVKDMGSLSNKIINIMPFRIKELKGRHIKVFNDEKVFFQKKNTGDLYIREALIFADKLPIVYARTVIPKKYLRGFWGRVKNLKNSPLSEIVFNKKYILRSNFVFKNLSDNDELTKRLNAYKIFERGRIMARKSVFNHRGQKALLTEVFLSSIEGIKFHEK